MQTFLPYPDFAASAAALDPVRLGKQRVEALQILRALVIPDYGWQRHPAVRMWMGYVPALTAYGLAMADEWLSRGRADTTRANILEFSPAADREPVSLPPWLGEDAFHAAHRSNLIQKDPAFYRSRFPHDDGGLPYVWPEPAQELLPSEPAENRLWIWHGATDEGGGTNRGAAHNYAVGAAGVDVGDGACRLLMPLQKPGGRATPKWSRQLAAFTDVVQAGDHVALGGPGALRYRIGTVDALTTDDDGTATRRVSLTGGLSRADMGYPALLQDPRTLFAVPMPAGW